MNSSPRSPRSTPHPEDRVLVYSAEGSAWKASRIVEILVDVCPGAEFLVVTAAQTGLRLESLDRVGVLRLPNPAGIRTGSQKSAALSALQSARRETLRVAVTDFCPDLVIVDGHPGVPDPELLTMIEALRSERPQVRIVLGIADVSDPGKARADGADRSREFAAMAVLFDEVWIFGSEETCDPAERSGFPRALAARTHFCGYLMRSAPPARPSGGAPRVVLTCGWESSGTELVEVYLEGLAGLTYQLAISTTVLLGPRIPASRRDELRLRYGLQCGVEFHDFDAPLVHHYARADVVVTTPDYEPVCESLSCDIPTLLVPGGSPSRAQALRAQRLAGVAAFQVIETEDLKPFLLIASVLDLLESGARRERGGSLCGPERLGVRARSLLDQPQR